MRASGQAGHQAERMAASLDCQSGVNHLASWCSYPPSASSAGGSGKASREQAFPRRLTPSDRPGEQGAERLPGEVGQPGRLRPFRDRCLGFCLSFIFKIDQRHNQVDGVMERVRHRRPKYGVVNQRFKNLSRHVSLDVNVDGDG